MTKRALIFRILMFLYIAVVSYLLFSRLGGTKIPKEIWGIEGDKFAHFWMFFPFTTLAVLSVENLPGKFPALTCLTFTLFLTGCGIAGLTELVQDIIPYREASWDDLRADVYSLAFSSLILYFTLLAIPSSKKKGKK